MQGVQTNPSKLVLSCMERWSLSVDRHPLRAAAGLGVCLGLLGVLGGFFVINAVLYFLPPEQWGMSGAARLAGLGPAAMFFWIVVFAPVVETALGQVLPMEAARRLGARPVVQVLLSGLVWGCGHYMSNGMAHGITAAFAGLIFAYAYAVLRPAGIRPAYIAAATAHATQNGISWAFIVFPAAA